jgi:hypothetical protein
MSKEVNITPSFKVIKSVLLYKDYETREEVLKVAQAMARTARDNDKFDEKTAAIYLEAFERIQSLNFEQMMALKEILKPIEMDEE